MGWPSRKVLSGEDLSTWLGHLCSLIVTYGNKVPTSHKDWDMGAISFLRMTSQKDASQILKKDIPGLQRKKEPGRRFISQRSIVFWSKYSEVNILRKGRSNPQVNSQLIFSIVGKIMQWEKDESLNNWH